MRNKIRKTAHRAMAIVLSAVMCAWLIPVGTISQVSAAGDEYITEITLEQDEMAADILEESGYTALPQGLNPGTTDVSALTFMGYKTGGEGSAIRDLKVSSSGKGSITVDGCSYQKISDISLNSGTGGSSLYLYAPIPAISGDWMVWTSS